MTNPWDNDNKAFEPMFFECVSIIGKRENETIKQTMNVSIFSEVYDSPLSEIDSETIVLDFVVLKENWPLVHTIRRGDTVLRNDSKYKVQQVIKDELLGWVIKAREINNGNNNSCNSW